MLWHRRCRFPKSCFFCWIWKQVLGTLTFHALLLGVCAVVRESRRRESERLSPSESPFYLTLTAELTFHKVSRTCQVVTISCCNVHAENQTSRMQDSGPFISVELSQRLRPKKKVFGFWGLLVHDGANSASAVVSLPIVPLQLRMYHIFVFLFFREIRSLPLKNGQYKDLVRTMISVRGFLSAVLRTFIFELRSMGKTFFWGRTGFWLQYLKQPLEKLAARPGLQYRVLQLPGFCQ